MSWQCALLGLAALVISVCALIVALAEKYHTHPDDELRAVCSPKITRAWLRAMKEPTK